jgi:hypothetical protein
VSVRGGDGEHCDDSYPARFRLPRIVRAEDAEREALYAMLVSLGETKLMAGRLMPGLPTPCRGLPAIIDFASDGQADMRGAISQLEEDVPWQRWRGGAT